MKKLILFLLIALFISCEERKEINCVIVAPVSGYYITETHDVLYMQKAVILNTNDTIYVSTKKIYNINDTIQIKWK